MGWNAWEPKTIWLNLSLLFFMSLIPLPTEALGQNPRAREAHLFFGGVMFACGVAYALLHLAISPDLEKVGKEAKAYLNWKNWGSTALMGASFAAGICEHLDFAVDFRAGAGGVFFAVAAFGERGR